MPSLAKKTVTPWESVAKLNSQLHAWNSILSGALPEITGRVTDPFKMCGLLGGRGPARGTKGVISWAIMVSPCFPSTLTSAPVSSNGKQTLRLAPRVILPCVSSSNMTLCTTGDTVGRTRHQPGHDLSVE